MKRCFFSIIFMCVSLVVSQSSSVGAAGSTVVKAKSSAEAQGFIFYTSHDQIVAAAKKEDNLKVLTGLDPEPFKALMSAFKRKYPFIEVIIQEASGISQHQRILLELKGGMTEWDTISIANDLYNEYIPYQKKFDILGMAKHGVLQINPKMIDPKNRNVVALTANIQVGVAYNKNLISAEKTPNTWEDYLRPEFKEKKFLADIRPTEIAALVPAWGLEKTLNYARKLAAQQPVWVRGGTRGLVTLVAGEHSMFIGNNYKTVRRMQRRDPTGVLQYKFLEPIPVRPSESVGVITTSGSPHSALLWIELLATAEGQKIIDDLEPFGASIYGPGSVQGQEIRGKNVSSVDWDHYTKLGDYQKKVVAAYGFPKNEIKRKRR